MIKVNVSVDIDRPSDQVFAFLADASNNTRWQKGMRSCQWTSAGPIAVGSTYEQEASFMGRTIRSSFEVTELDPGHQVTITSTNGTFPIMVTRSVDRLDVDACRARARISGGPTGIGRIFDPITQLLVQSSVRRDYRRLKELLEGS
jgi:uncharacterized membrane protein